jgi:hypothetical protein
MMAESIRQLRGANMDIDIIPRPGLKWEQDVCPWNEADGSSSHKCTLFKSNTGQLVAEGRIFAKA